MADPIPIRRPINLQRLRSDEAETLIHERAKVTANIYISGHAYKREEDRTIIRPDVYRILRTGFVEGDPIINEYEKWQATMVMRMPGTREAGVVTVICENDDQLEVRTVMWMDYIR